MGIGDGFRLENIGENFSDTTPVILSALGRFKAFVRVRLSAIDRDGRQEMNWLLAGSPRLLLTTLSI
jgi:hypothetical protein